MPRSYSKLAGDVHEAAALWWARMSSDVKTQADEAAFDAWLAESPEHVSAYAETCALAGRFDAMAAHPQIAELRAETQLFEERTRRPLFARIGLSSVAAALAVVVVAVAALYFVAAPFGGDEWATTRGQARQIVLSDGSKVTLGSDSRMRVRFRRTHRDVSLARGQAFFDVAHDAARPFTVRAADRTVTALGTAFDVRSYPDETTITLLSGRVSITRERGDREVLLEAGQQFRVDAGVETVRDVDAAAETGWRTGVLEFDAVFLTEAAMKFNRSAPHSIIVSDPRLMNLRVSGVFRADDPQGFAAALVPAYPLTATVQSSGDIVLTYREGREAATRD